MRKIIFLFIVSLSLLAYSCKEITTQDTSRITYYVTFQFDDVIGTDQLGNNEVIIPKGTSYDVTQHFTATEGDKDVAGSAQIDGTVDGNTPGYYPVAYSAVNVDGYAAAKVKGVFVSDPSVTTNMEGAYSATVSRVPGSSFSAGFPANVVKITDGIFYIDRLLGSYYYDGLGYSAYGSYFVHGFVYLHPDNTLTLCASYCPAWRDELAGLNDGMYDPATGIITFTSIYAGGRQFFVTLTPSN